MFAYFKKKFLSFWANGKDSYKSLVAIQSAPKLFWIRQNALLRENLEKEEDLMRTRDFADVLRDWGITTEEELQFAICDRRRARIVGLCLFLGGLFLMIWNPSIGFQTLYWRTLQGFFYLSMASLGAFMVIACTWRLQVFSKQKFVPFLVWVRRGGCI